MSQNVLVVTGAGGMGTACVRRLAAGRKAILADISEEVLAQEQAALAAEGFIVETQKLDVSDYSSVDALIAKSIAGNQRVQTLVHTAGLSPIQASAKAIYNVDLVGTVNIIDAFLPVASPGFSIVCISSMAGHLYRDTVNKDFEQHLAHSPRDKLLDHEGINLLTDHPHVAYGIAKRGNQLRVCAAAKAYGDKGARINSISPGVILTPMGKQEMDGPAGAQMREMIQGSPANRAGTAYDIANAVAFLTSSDAAFVTGTDLLVDGGVTGVMQFGDKSILRV